MARGRKSTTIDTEDDKGILKLIEYNPDIMQDGSKTPNILIDNFVGVAIDENNYELVKVKQITVTEDNIKSTTNIYKDKFAIGDTYQEWSSMGKYLSSYESAVECYSGLKFKNDASKLKYCKDINILNKIKSDIHNTIYKFAVENTVPQISKELSTYIKTLNDLKVEINTINILKQEAINECTKVTSIMKGKYAEMVSKGLVKPKKTEHPIKEETE